MCTVPHKRSSGYRYGDVVRTREILERAWGRTPNPGPTDEEIEIIDGFKRGRHAPQLSDTDPIPMLAVAQLYRRDVPGLPDTGEGDLLQVFWCGFERHGETRHEPCVHLRWRHSQDIGTLLTEQPVPEVVGREELVPSPCVLHPEVVVEHPYFMSLDPALQERIAAWEGPESAGDRYVSELSTAPGWKVGGYVAWPLTGPRPLVCSACGAELSPLLTADEREWDPSTTSWIPYEDRQNAGGRWPNVPTGVSPGRGRLTIAVCPRDPHHPIDLVVQ
ncbi:hypothetical protein [Streptomyces sp. NPDC046976]|uniref:hypothetical protein n=1 Tax=unclassified Streptomyces TaxID=2593676 RepID=UPI0033CB314F